MPTTLKRFVKQAVRFAFRLAASGAVVAGVLLVLGGGYCLWRGNCSIGGYADSLLDTSLLAAAASALAVMGSAMLGTNANYQLARTAGEATAADRTRQDVRASEGRLSWTLRLAAGAIEAAAIGFLIKAVSGPPVGG